jgi:hypothetical protein
MELSERDMRMVLRGMSIARGILKNTPCDHHTVVRDYQEVLGEAWQLPHGADVEIVEKAEFRALLDQMGAAVYQLHPDWIMRDGSRYRPKS